MYSVDVTRSFQDDFSRLDAHIASLVLEKVQWIAMHPEAARYGVQYLPEDLKGLQKYRIGHYRVFFWIEHNARRIVLYRVLHRREAYRHF
ncbi:type II toxin-antitoxin system RelE/ParE family toxin [Candidatus Uhrbacteria bacterium]|nr:type II toxin-antitoxin system RelE/ParE family toxin [Candidatus Uhrbacteria bacterium]